MRQLGIVFGAAWTRGGMAKVSYVRDLIGVRRVEE